MDLTLAFIVLPKHLQIVTKKKKKSALEQKVSLQMDMVLSYFLELSLACVNTRLVPKIVITQFFHMQVAYSKIRKFWNGHL